MDSEQSFSVIFMSIADVILYGIIGASAVSNRSEGFRARISEAIDDLIKKKSQLKESHVFMWNVECGMWNVKCGLVHPINSRMKIGVEHFSDERGACSFISMLWGNIYKKATESHGFFFQNNI